MIYRKFWPVSSELSVSFFTPQARATSTRSVISGFSRKSRTRLRRQISNASPPYRTMLTLTYGVGYPATGPESKRHLLAFRDGLRRYNLLPPSVVWFLEFQNRGAPHFHLLVQEFIPKWAVSWIWHWASGAPVITATNIGALDQAAAYALKYAQKFEQKTIPESFSSVGRFWGIWGVKYHNKMVATTVELSNQTLEVSQITAMEMQEIGLNRRVIRNDSGFCSYPKREKR